MGKIINTNYDLIADEVRKAQLLELNKNSIEIKKYELMIEELIKTNKHLSSVTGKEI